MGFLTDEPIVDIEVHNCRFFVNVSFDRILLVQQLYEEDELSELDKLDQALKMLVVNRQKLRRLSVEQKSELLTEIYNRCVNVQQRPAIRKSLPVFDFEYDGEYIYASFLLDYGIDLIDMQGKLSWKKFIALFQGLSEKSKIREVMRIRSTDIPRYDGHNQKQIQEIQELKSYYALPVKGGGGQQGLDSLFVALEAMAVKNNNSI